MYDAAVALDDVLDKLTYPLAGSWDDKPACRPDVVSIINGYVFMYVRCMSLLNTKLKKEKKIKIGPFIILTWSGRQAGLSSQLSFKG